MNQSHLQIERERERDGNSSRVIRKNFGRFLEFYNCTGSFMKDKRNVSLKMKVYLNRPVLL
jgi:hypothetical protein